ncbi:MAG: homoserine O-acetyltransferase MetX [Balneolaceae bacterium]
MNQGITKTTLNSAFVTESGFRFEKPDVAYKTWGNLNAERDNAVVICHALTGHAAADEWFPGLLGDGKICDPGRHFVICINVPGSCYGSVGPLTVNPKTGTPYLGNFPDITIRDMVRFQQQLLDELDIRGIELVIGASLGGMQALEFAIMEPRVRSAVLIAMGKAHSPWAIGISHAQRHAIYADPNWNGGFYEPGKGPDRGVAAARMMAMITYRTPEDYQQKFGRSLQGHSDRFQVESYLEYQGEKLARRFDANTYVILSKAMDTHDIERGRDFAERVLNRVEIPVQIVGITSDHLYPVQEQKEIAALLPNGRYYEIDSPYGHDAFLIEFEQLHRIVHPFTHIQQIVTA